MSHSLEVPEVRQQCSRVHGLEVVRGGGTWPAEGMVHSECCLLA